MEFETNEALVDWMQDEGLSPFALLKLTPKPPGKPPGKPPAKPSAKPQKPPASVVMEWGVQDLEHEGDRDKFLAWRVTAEEIEVFRSEGAIDTSEECNTELGEGPGIDLRFEVGGTLLLRCARLVVSDKPVERFRKSQPRPHHGEFILTLDPSAFTWATFRKHLGIPAELATLKHLELTPVDKDAGPRDVKQVTIMDSAKHSHVWLGVEGNRITVAHGKWASDELWATIWAKGRKVPGVTQISSRDLVTAPADWPESPPPKPAPQVWPNVFGVECDFADMTLADLCACLELPATTPFAFEDEDAPPLTPQLTLGQAARHDGATEITGFFQTEAGKPLVRCRADLRESNLSFTRERACPDPTWLSIWRCPTRLPGFKECHSRTTQSPPDPWPSEPPRR